MSRICQGCGGILGRDCYNEQDCISISASMGQYDQYEMQRLQDENNYLRQLLSDNGIEIPEPKIESIDETTKRQDDDDYPF